VFILQDIYHRRAQQAVNLGSAELRLRREEPEKITESRNDGKQGGKHGA
jgi:hypothetical protein